MKLPLQITTRKMTLSDSATEIIKQKASKLETFYNHIIACRVMVEMPHRHKHQGVLFNVRIDITVPGSELVVKREPHEDMNVAIRDAFDAARRQLQAFNTKRRRDTKMHGVPATAHVTKLFAERGFGFIETPDGRELYFDSDSVARADFDDLHIGATVRYAEKSGDAGPQAFNVSMRLG